MTSVSGSVALGQPMSAQPGPLRADAVGWELAAAAKGRGGQQPGAETSQQGRTSLLQ